MRKKSIKWMIKIDRNYVKDINKATLYPILLLFFLGWITLAYDYTAWSCDTNCSNINAHTNHWNCITFTKVTVDTSCSISYNLNGHISNVFSANTNWKEYYQKGHVDCHWSHGSHSSHGSHWSHWSHWQW